MANSDLKSMSLDELWSLHEFVVGELSRKIMAERATLENRLRQLGSAMASSEGKGARAKRPYPKVLPKYRNPKIVMRPGQAEASSLAGWRLSFDPEKSWLTF